MSADIERRHHGDAPRCPCGCRQVWDAGEQRPHCPHCELPPDDQAAALLDHLPPCQVRG